MTKTDAMQNSQDPLPEAAEAPSLTLYTQAQTAEMLKCSERTLEGWRYRGIGPKPTKIGGRIRYRHDKLKEWIDGCTDEGPDDGVFK